MEKSKLDRKEIEELIVKLSKEGNSSTKIGQILKDVHGVASTKKAIGSKIKKILEKNKIKAEIPDDLNSLIKTAGALRKHLEKHKQDKNSVRGLLVAESNLRALAKYYKRKGILPKDWQY